MFLLASGNRAGRIGSSRRLRGGSTLSRHLRFAVGRGGERAKQAQAAGASFSGAAWAAPLRGRRGGTVLAGCPGAGRRFRGLPQRRCGQLPAGGGGGRRSERNHRCAAGRGLVALDRSPVTTLRGTEAFSAPLRACPAPHRRRRKAIGKTRG